MNKYTLKFDNQELETLYQDQQLDRIRKPIYVGLCIGSLFLNLFKVINDLQAGTINRSYVNLGFLIFTILQFFYVRTNIRRRRIIISISSYLMVLLQLDLKLDSEKHEAYLYGANMMMFHAAFYITSNFSESILQVIIQLGGRITITVLFTVRIDYQGYFTGLAGSIYLLIGLYYCDYNSRNCFLSSLREDNKDEHFPFLLNKPFLYFRFDKEKLQFQLIRQGWIEKFHGFQPDDCNGCNLRRILRSYDYKDETLETRLFHKTLPQEFEIDMKIKGETFRLRYCDFGVEESKFILILEEQFKKIYNYKQLKQSLVECGNTFKKCSSLNISKVVYWNIMCSFALNEKKVKKICISNILEKYVRIFKRISQTKIVIVKQRDIQIKTYVNLVNILFVQIFNILVKNKNEQIVFIKLNKSLKIQLNQPKIFEEQYYNNYFIKQIEPQILSKPMNKNIEFLFIKQVYVPFQ